MSGAGCMVESEGEGEDWVGGGITADGGGGGKERVKISSLMVKYRVVSKTDIFSSKLSYFAFSLAPLGCHWSTFS